MFKKLSKFIDLVLFIIVIFMVITAYGNFSASKPIFMSSIRSNSMYPKFQRGDVIFLSPLTIEDEKKIGDIIVFRDMEGALSSKGYIVHRIHSGNVTDGFITKGDNNNKTDQAGGDVPAIHNDWIYSKVIEINGQPLKIPKMGYISLFVIEQGDSSAIPKYIVTIVAMIVILEVFKEIKLSNKKKKKNRRNKRRHQKTGTELIFPSVLIISIGLIMSMFVFATTFTISKNVSLFYGVDTGGGILQGSQIGIIENGSKKEGKLTKLANSGFIPLYVSINTLDKQISVSQNNFWLRGGDQVIIDYTINGQVNGTYDSKVFVGVFFPLLPPYIITLLNEHSHLMLVVFMALIPSLPLTLYPFISSSHRQNIKKYVTSIF